MNIVLDPVGATNVEQTIDSLATDGRWVLYGTMGGIGVSNNKFLGLLLRKRIQLLSTTLRARSLEVRTVLLFFLSIVILSQWKFPIVELVTYQSSLTIIQALARTLTLTLTATLSISYRCFAVFGFRLVARYLILFKDYYRNHSTM